MRSSRIENSAKSVDNKNTKKVKKSKSSKGSIVGTILKFIFIIILALILAVECWYLVELKEAEGDATKAAMRLLKNVANTVIDEEDPVYILLLGYSTDEGNTLTDTIILLGYNPSTQKAFMVSVPRDTYIGTNIYKADSYDKINSLYSSEDATATVEAVEDITGINIDYYATINTDVLVQVVDIIGGVEFDVPIDMDYDDKSQNLHIHLDAGLQVLDGDQAEQLLRFRHNNDGTSYDSEYGDNDYGRMHTQRDFLIAVAQQVMENYDLSTLTEIASTILDNLETDIPASVIASYLVYLYDFDMDNLETATLPGESTRIPAETGLYFFKYDEDETEELITDILEKFNSEISNDELESEEDDVLETENTTNEINNQIEYNNY